MNILLIGDICGRPGRETLTRYLDSVKDEYAIDFTIANGENAAAGMGITKKVLEGLYDGGVDVVTSGNHIWDKKEIFTFIDEETRLIRPANYPPGTPGRGYTVVKRGGCRIAVVNLAGRTFMPAMDCPFRKMDEIITALSGQSDIILLDFHAETTSEKMAMGWYVDGRITGMVGTHTHIQTADERILPQGTAYITDIGMVGPYNSVLGVDKNIIIKRFISALPAKFELADGPNVFSGIVFSVDEFAGSVTNVKRILITE